MLMRRDIWQQVWRLEEKPHVLLQLPHAERGAQASSISRVVGRNVSTLFPKGYGGKVLLRRRIARNSITGSRGRNNKVGKVEEATKSDIGLLVLLESWQEGRQPQSAQPQLSGNGNRYPLVFETTEPIQIVN